MATSKLLPFELTPSQTKKQIEKAMGVCTLALSLGTQKSHWPRWEVTIAALKTRLLIKDYEDTEE